MRERDREKERQRERELASGTEFQKLTDIFYLVESTGTSVRRTGHMYTLE